MGGVALGRVLMDGLALAGAVMAAFPLRFRWHLLETTPGRLDVTAHLWAGLAWVVCVLAAMASHRLYDEDTLAPSGQETSRIARSLLYGIALASTAVFLLRFVTVSRGWFVLVVGTSFVFLLAERSVVRAVLHRLRSRGLLRRPAILVATETHDYGDDAEFAEFDILACVRPEELAARLLPEGGGVSPRSRPVIIVEDGPGIDRDEIWRLVMQAGDASSSVLFRSPFRPLPGGRLATRTLGGRTTMKVSPPALTGIRAFEKRLLDILLSAFLLVALALPAAAIAAAILVTSGRPVLYRQRRVGKDGRLFSMLKFRTMRVDAEAESGPIWSTKGDPRRTGLGAILRRLSLDELPQLWNVLVGHMSIVGPRPERPMFVASFSDGNPWYRFRHRIRPGITGLAQVRGLRGDTPLEPRVESDNWYIEHWSLGLDARIAARTFLEMVRGRGAG